MSVSFNSNLRANPRIAFTSNNNDKNGSYPTSAVSGALIGGVVGAGVKKGAQVYVERKDEQVTSEMLKNLAVKSYTKAAGIGALIGAAALMVVHAFKGKKEEPSAAESLKPIS